MSSSPFSDAGYQPSGPNPYDPSAYPLPPRKPGALTAVGVMAVVLGSLGILGSCMALGTLPFQSQLQTAFNQPNSNDPIMRIQAEMNTALAAVQEKYFIVSIFLAVLHLVMAICLLVGGILVLRTHPAGRRFLLYVLLAAIAFEVLRTVVGIVMQMEMMPITSQFMERMMRESGPNNAGATVGRMMKGFMVFGMVLGLIWPLAKIILYGLSARYLASQRIVDFFAQQGVKGAKAAICVALLLGLAPCDGLAAEVAWKMHTINAQSEFPACAAFDVDHDGDIDIYSGGWWYEAPSWKKHKVRDVEVIRGRYDDYSNQPMDANGDGWTDIISVNYRSETIYWIEHPGKNLGKQDWTAHVIDKPGPSETGRLHDIDGDGDLDILPNGTTYAAWYEFKPEKKEDGTLEPKWVKHDLPKEMAGHGIGIRVAPGHATIYGPSGWLSATRAGEFQWEGPHSRPSLLLHRDASVPILPLSIDPGHIDFVWGRGHRTGLYSSLSGTSKLIQERLLSPIDTSWSQCHAPLVADIDNDGAVDLIAGKRYLGHEGKDPGEYDPLVIYWYSLDRRTTSWTRHVIQENGPAGIDLDGTARDIDNDGDIDLVAPSRHGLFLFENLSVNNRHVEATTWDDRQALAAYQNHAQLLVFATKDGDLRPVKTPFDWSTRRWHVLRSMEAVMGPLPNPSQRIPVRGAGRTPLPRVEESRASDGGDVQCVLYSIQTDQGPASELQYWLLTPTKKSSSMPAMLCLHPTSIPHGKKVVTGHEPKNSRSYALELAARGYVCICPDYPTMGEHPFDLAANKDIYQSGTMKAIWDNVRCLDVLESLPYVDPDRIGVIGHSLGGHNGMFTACFDQRIKCVVTSCGFTPFHDYYGGKLDGWTQDRYMPRIRDVYESNPDKMPFDFYEVMGAIAPRPIFINAPLHDDNFDVNGVKKCVAEAQKVYVLLGKKDGITARYPDDQHDFPEKERMEAYEWLDKVLK